MSIAAYLHDIGKAGPFDASPETQAAIVKLYAVENIANPDQPIAETVRANFSLEVAASMFTHLGACGLRSTDTMRAFWDRHGYWIHDILEADSDDVPVRARVIAGSHHTDRGIDPYDISGGEHMDMVENRILLAVDKSRYGHDVIMNRVLQLVDAVGKEESSFSAAA
jgi:hypothetical protein